MRKVFFVTLLLGLFSNGFSQSFLVLPSDSVFTSMDPNGEEALFIFFENISGQSISVQYQEVVANYPPGWFVQVCDNNACFALPHPQGSTWSFMPGDSSFICIHAFPLGIPGFGLFCYDLTDTVAGYTTSICLSFDARMAANMMQTEENDLQIFPNPTHSTIQLVANGKKLNKGVAEIINVHGLVVKRVEIVASANQELNVSDVPVGIYQLVYTTDSGTLSRKVVVAR
jgi:hypothetical protein